VVRVVFIGNTGAKTRRVLRARDTEAEYVTHHYLVYLEERFDVINYVTGRRQDFLLR